MSDRRIKYDQEFKDNADRYCIEKADSITKGAEELGISKCSVFRWVSEYKAKHMSPAEKEEKRGRETSKMSILEKELRETKRRNFELMEQSGSILRDFIIGNVCIHI